MIQTLFIGLRKKELQYFIHPKQAAALSFLPWYVWNIMYIVYIR